MAKPGGVTKYRTEKSKGRERRRQERFDCNGAAEVIVDDLAFLFRGNIQNFSLGGCYIESRARLRLDRGAEVDLHFNLNGDFFNARARIMIVRPGAGAGFQFLPNDTDLQRRLAGLIQQRQVVSSADVARNASADRVQSPPASERQLWDRVH